MTAIVVDNISKKFRIPHQKKTTLFQRGLGLIRRQEEFEEFWAVRDVSFDVGRGETFGIIGRNGSGKSTLLKMLAKVLYPDSGKIATTGRVACFLELGVGFQLELTAEENVYIYSSILGMSNKQTKKIYNAIFDFAELKKFENMKLKNFSSGMIMRLAFSAAFHTDPDIVLIDEVLAVGDESFQKKCVAKINEFKDAGKTIIFVSHSLDAVSRICTRSMLINDGKVLAMGENEVVIKKYLELMGN